MSTSTNKSLSHKTRRKARNRWRWRDVGELILFLLALVSFLAIPASLLCGVGLIVMMCWGHSELGFALLSVLVVICVSLFLARRILRKREFQSWLARGVDFGLKDESLQAVDEIVEKYGKRRRRASAIKVEVAPMVRSLDHHPARRQDGGRGLLADQGGRLFHGERSIRRHDV